MNLIQSPLLWKSGNSRGAFLFVLFAVAGAARSSPAEGQILAAFQFSPRSEALALPVQVGEERGNSLFVLDTGASVNFLDSSLQHLVNSKPFRRVRIEGTQRFLELYKFPGVSVGDLRASKDGQIVCTDLADLRAAAGMQLYGIVGLGFFRDRVVSVDFDNGLLQVWSRSCAREGLGVAVRLTDDSTKAIIEKVRFGDNMSYRCILDTGSNGSIVVPRGTFDHLVRSKQVSVLGSRVVTSVDRKSRQRFGVLKRLEIASGVIHNLTIGESTRDSIPRIGLGVLRRYVVTLDVDGKVAYFRKGKHFASTDRLDKSGITLDRVLGEFRATSITKNSPALVADIRVGDRIEMVNGIDQSRLSMYTLRELLSSGHGRVITVKVRSDNQDSRTVALKLRNRPYDE
jgi:hypothetical protein